MKAITSTPEIVRFLHGLVDRQVPTRLHPPSAATVFGGFVEVTHSRILRFVAAEGTLGPRPGASVQVTGVHEGGAFGFVADYLGQDANAWLIGAPYRIDVRQRRETERFSPTRGMLLRLAVGGRHYEADLVDLSEGRLGFSTSELPFQLRPGARLEGRLDLERNRFVPVHLEVAHVHARGAGVRILSIPEPARREIRGIQTRAVRPLAELSLS